jgi:TonB family protein
MKLAVILTLILAQASPLPAPSSTPSDCSHDAEVTDAAIPDDTVQTSEGDVFAIVAVQVASDGAIEKVKIYRTSGDLLFDQASVRAARRSKYRPKVVDCKPVEGIFYFKTSRTQGYAPGPRDKPTPPPWPKSISPPPDLMTPPDS